MAKKDKTVERCLEISLNRLDYLLRHEMFKDPIYGDSPKIYNLKRSRQYLIYAKKFFEQGNKED